MNRRFEVENGPAIDLLNVVAIGRARVEGGAPGLYRLYPPTPYKFSFDIRFHGDPSPLKIITGFVDCRREFSKTGWGIFKSEVCRQWFDEKEVQEARDANQMVRDSVMSAWRAFHDQAN